MKISIQGAREHNLQSIDAEFGDGLTVVTGVSGSGKSSLVFDTLYHEARRRFLEIFSTQSRELRMSPSNVGDITGLGPAVAVGQNLLNRNPLSTLATACGLHPFLRLLYSNFGQRCCSNCGNSLSVQTEDEIIEQILEISKKASTTLYAPLMHGIQGTHQTLLELLSSTLGKDSVFVDGQAWDQQQLNPEESHNIDIKLAQLKGRSSRKQVREIVQMSAALGVYAVSLETEAQSWTYSRAPVCTNCGTWFKDLEPIHFHTPCPFCKGKGCRKCYQTGLLPQAATVHWNNLRMTDLLKLSVDEALSLFKDTTIPVSASRLQDDILRRLEALHQVGLGYISLDRSSPSLSRGESQRVRLAIILTSRLEDMLHVLDEPTIGQHPADVSNLLEAFRQLKGSVVYVEHDRIAAASADQAIDLGPGAGDKGGKVIFQGTPAELWEAETPTGRYFSTRERVQIPEPRPKPQEFLTIEGASLHNLKGIDVPLPIGRLTVITGVSGSGKSSLVEDVLFKSLKGAKMIGCNKILGPKLKPILVDQSPIGRNPRSNPATYTKLSDIIRDHFAHVTGLSASHFSFNRPEGACPTCNGMGAVEIKMRYLPSTWIQCSDCDGQRFSDDVLASQAPFGDRQLSIADFYRLSISEAMKFLIEGKVLTGTNRRSGKRILNALCDIGLGYLPLGQPSPTLSGGEAQRVKLAKYLGRATLAGRLLILDEPSTGLHPQDLNGLIAVLDRLVRSGATIIVVEHNLDIIRAADWIVDLGPGAGPAGGHVVYTGPPDGLMGQTKSITGQALKSDVLSHPPSRTDKHGFLPSKNISIQGARAHNLKDVNIDFPKGALTVVTGVSGSGKSSLIGDVLEAEARRRYLETLSLYERQSTREGPEAPVDSVTGLGVTATITAERKLYDRRSTVGTATGIGHHLAVLFSAFGQRECLHCGVEMKRDEAWNCPVCGSTAPLAEPRHFSPSTYSAACVTCNGVGSLQIPKPEKLIVNPEKPLCAGAMYSPGFFPQGYLCKPFNGGYDIVQAVAERYDFDPMTLPWNAMTTEAQQAFLFGDPEPLPVTFHSRTGRITTRKIIFRGFYGWLGDWDVGGTYTENRPCPDCKGSRLRPEYLAVTFAGHNIHQLSEIPLDELTKILEKFKDSSLESHFAFTSMQRILTRLRFLNRVGLGYLHLNRISGTLSAGEAQRVKLAGMLGSELTSLTVLLDEPSRGMHPSEVEALLNVLFELRNEGNTVIVVEHDPLFIRNADYLVDMGPGAGIAGGKIVAQGKPSEVTQADTITAKWLRGECKPDLHRERREPQAWMRIVGARANNLSGDEIQLPISTLTGICGVSGSGKSTLLIDTIGRALAPKKHTTSVAHEPLEPGEYDEIVDAPARTVVLDQAKKGISSPLSFLTLDKSLLRLFADSPEAKDLGLDQKQLGSQCSVCRGAGVMRMDMGFLPDVYTPCDTCNGTGYSPEGWDVRLNGFSLPELNTLTLDEIYELFKEDATLRRNLKMAHEVGLGYLVLRQPRFALSGGEVQRLKIAKELCRKTSKDTLFILDEPTLGQHLEDVERLMSVLHRLVEEGHTVVVVEHHPHVLAACDWLIELGPGGGPQGGQLIANGTPETIARGNTPTASYLREVLEAEL
jgi:excinuclease ABC subunit A